MIPTLTAFIDIANIPKKYGGGLDFESGMAPVLDPAVLDVLSLTAPESSDAPKMFLTAPVRWIDGPGGDLVALGVGSSNGVQRRETVATMHAHAAQKAFQPPRTPGPQYRSEYFVTQDTAAQNPGLQGPGVQISGVQDQTPQISAATNPEVENGIIQDFAKLTTSVNGEVKNTQPVPVTARGENVLPGRATGHS